MTSEPGIASASTVAMRGSLSPATVPGATVANVTRAGVVVVASAGNDRDDFGFDADLTDHVLLPPLRPLYDKWFRVETRGLDNVPDVGGAALQHPVGEEHQAIAGAERTLDLF